MSTRDGIKPKRKRRPGAPARKRAAARERQLEIAIENISQGVCMFDASGRIVLCNRRYLDMYGLSPDVVKPGCSLMELLRHRHQVAQLVTDPEEVGRAIIDSISKGEAIERLIETRSGRVTRAISIPIGGGGWVATHEDITDQRDAELSFRLLFENNPVPMFVYAEEGLGFLAVNDAAVAHYGYSREQFLTMNALDIRPAEDRDVFRKTIEGGVRNYREGSIWRHRKADGTTADMAIFARHLNYDGKPALLVAVIDVTERNLTEARLRETQNFLDTVIENVPVAIIVKNADDLRYLLVNRTAEQFLGMARSEIIGRTTHEVLPRASADYIVAYDKKALAAVDPVIFDDVTLDTPRRGTRVSSGRRLVVRSDGKPKYLLAVIQDVTDRKQAEARIAHLTEHDPLTGLPNRAAFHQHLATALTRARSSRRQIGILRLGLDRFKEINDVFSEAVGDDVLREVAHRLLEAGAEAFLARLGGDEFSLIVEGRQPATAEALADRLQAALAGGFAIKGHELRIGVSIGVALFPGDGNDATTLVGNADAALHRAKADGRGIIRFFDGDIDRRLRDRRALQHDLRSAVARNELSLYYQPQARLDRSITGFEALVRWRHPTRGLVLPTTFIPVAEESSLIFEIGDWVLREACREAASWPARLRISVNLSALQLRQGDLPGLVRSILADTGLASDQLELEITEGVLIDDHQRAVAILTELKSQGVRIVLDDFGTGYSSLSYLQSFPFDKIKIDRSFIRNLDSPQSASITRAIMTMGHGLGLPILAEGVETEDQLAFLVREACDEVQGALIGGAHPLDQYAAMLGRASAQAPADRGRVDTVG